MNKPKWLRKPEEKDYVNAVQYMSLLCDWRAALEYSEKLRTCPDTTRKAKDILRASGEELLPRDDDSVRRHTDQMRAGDPWSPILLVVSANGLHIVDGYHRTCAAYHDGGENADVPCRIYWVPEE